MDADRRAGRSRRPAVWLTATVLAGLLLGTTGLPVRAADPVLLVAGDIATCLGSADSATAAILDDEAGPIAALGDLAYPDGTAVDFHDCFDPTWGRHRDRIRPTAGNHEYHTAGAWPYWDYFGAAAGSRGRGWYSFDLGTWHIVVLNSNCDQVSCSSAATQAQWLRNDLAGRAGGNILAYWHHPRYSSGFHGSTTTVRLFWEILYAAGADVVLGGHDHDYERFAPQDPWARLDSAYGMRQFVVGTGGTELRPLAATAPNSRVFQASTHGILKLTLRSSRYDWEFLPVAGKTFSDAGSTASHGAPPARTTRTVKVTTDAHVDQARPSTSFATAPTMSIDGDTAAGLDTEAYLRFTVPTLGGPVDRAVLRLWALDPTTDGPRVYRTGTGWTGSSLTWKTRPAVIGGALADLGPVVADAWLEIDVTSVVSSGGSYAFGLRPTSTNGLVVSSLQGTHPPELIVQTIP